MKHPLKKLALAAALTLSFGSAPVMANTADAKAFLHTYADIAVMSYTDSLADAKKLQSAVHAFTKAPSEKTLDAAKKAWLASRETYGLSEIFRLSNGPIDAEEGWIAESYGALEGQINAWPLDENMIDYTIDAEGKRTSGNIIDSTGNFTPAELEEKPEGVNVDNITIETITALNENGGEANVASGYHAIEFLLWGQDQDYSNLTEDKITHGAMMAGQRPLSDFTTDKFAKRRIDYLNAAADKLVADLTLVQSAWLKDNGMYRAALLNEGKSDKNIDQKTALRQIFTGMGMFLKSELANERIAVAVLTPSEEDEHSCFSDNTHRDIDTNYQGFKNVLLGTYNGKKVGSSVMDSLHGDNQQAVSDLMQDIEKRIAQIDKVAKETMHFDYQITHESEAKNIVTLKNQLRKLGDAMVLVAKDYDVSISENDVTDPEETKL